MLFQPKQCKWSITDKANWANYFNEEKQISKEAKSTRYKFCIKKRPIRITNRPINRLFHYLLGKRRLLFQNSTFICLERQPDVLDKWLNNSSIAPENW